MTDHKVQRIDRAKKSLTKAGIAWKEFNQGLHWKIGALDFWPTTGKWIDGVEEGRGVQELIKRLKPPAWKTKVLTVEQIFEIAKHSKDRSLEGICAAIHEEIYNGKMS